LFTNVSTRPNSHTAVSITLRGRGWIGDVAGHGDDPGV